MKQPSIIRETFTIKSKIMPPYSELTRGGMGNWEGLPSKDMLTRDMNLSAVVKAIIDIRDKIDNVKQALSIQIYDLDSSKFSLKCPMSVLITRENGIYYTQSVDLNLYGEGENEIEAIQDLKKAIIISYQSLSESEKKLSPLMKSKLKFLFCGFF
ncbi:hypothetical protein KKE68_05320, partial [Patescibacteria group bacterium]|nr:hypothetical protein [Patescibacteria group bacterium]